MGQTCYPEKQEKESNMSRRRRLSSCDSTSSMHSKIFDREQGECECQISAEERQMLYKSWRNAVETADITKLYQLMEEGLLHYLDYHWDDGSSALQIACKNKEHQLALCLLTQGINVNEKNTQTLDTALHIAVRNQNEKLVGLLLEWDADPNIKNKKGETALAIATDKRVRALLEGDWFPLIGFHGQNLVPRSLQNELKNECRTLIANKDYLDTELYFSKTKFLKIQGLIEPCKPSFDQLQSDGNVKPHIPAIFRLNEETNLYEIKSDINDLPKEKYLNLYSVIGRIFNQVVSHVRDGMHSNEYYVIVKMYDFQFVDQVHSSYAGGSFHSEILHSEYIKEVALYYFDISDNINGGGLTFQRPSGSIHFADYTPSIGIKDNDFVIFSNSGSVQHKVDKMNINWQKNWTEDGLYKNKNGAKVYGTHKVLAFYIADTTKHDKIRTSKDVVVNFEFKIYQIVDYWMREVELMSNGDVSMIILAFVLNATLIKMKTEANRRKRFTDIITDHPKLTLI